MQSSTYYIALDTEYVNITSTQNRLLSWQFCISLNRRTISDGYIRYIAEKEKRPKLQEIILQAFNTIGITPENLNDKHIVIICHYCPAELAMLSDKISREKINDLKFLIKNMEYVRKTIISLYGQKFKIEHTYKDHSSKEKKCTWSYEFFDTKLIAPNGAASLSDLSKALSDKRFHKKEMNFYEISHMNWVLKFKKDKFQEYAINDAKATLMSFIELQNNFNDLEETKSFEIKRTIGSAALSYYSKFLKEQYNLTPADIIGKGSTVQVYTKEKFSECYHGGRNETFYIGQAPEEYIYFDIDYKNAYPTCLSMLHGIDWQATPIKIQNLKQLMNMKGVQLNSTYIQATFEFPQEVKYPCLPEFHEKYGLIYPLSGTTYTTAHEILLAHKMGAKINIIDGKMLQPKRLGSTIFHPFSSFYKKIIAEREKHPKKSMKNLLYKEFSNTLYGKVSQNVANKNTYGLFSDGAKALGDSKISSSALASNITGIMRAALGELLYTCEVLNAENKEQKYLPLNAVTDGALIGIKRKSFTAETLEKIENNTFTSIKEILPNFMSKLEESSLINLLMKTRKEITESESLLEIKSISNKVWTFKTRGSVGYYNDKLTLYTKAGHKPPMIEDIYRDRVEKDEDLMKYEHKYFRPRTDEEGAQWLLDVYNSVPEIQTYNFSRLLTLKDLIDYNNDYEDMLSIITERKTNLDFDYKRKPNFQTQTNVDEDTELTNVDTLPFNTKAEMLTWRKASENLRASSKRTYDLRSNGYRATPVKVSIKVHNKDKDRFGEKGSRVVIVKYVIQAYVKNKLCPFTCQYNYTQIEKIFFDKKFATYSSHNPLINKEAIRTLANKNFIPTKLPNNAYVRMWVRNSLKQLGIKPNQTLLKRLIAS